MRRNKNKRNLTKLKLSNSTRACVSIVALVLFVVSSCFLYVSIFEKKDSQVEKEIYDYKNDYKLDYKVKIKDNEFIEESTSSCRLATTGCAFSMKKNSMDRGNNRKSNKRFRIYRLI